MSPIRVGNFSVEIGVNNIDGFIHGLIDVPFQNGFWVMFTVKDHTGKAESLPLVDKDHRLKIYQSYTEALHDAAQRLTGIEPRGSS